MSAVEELRARRDAREEAADMRAWKSGARRRDAARKAAYEAGRRGEAVPFEGEDDELYELYNAGQEDGQREERESARPADPEAAARKAARERDRAVAAARTKRRARATRARSTARRATRAGRTTARAFTGGTTSVLSLIGIAFGLVALYLILTRASAFAGAAGGVLRFFVWLADPHATVPPQGASA